MKLQAVDSHRGSLFLLTVFDSTDFDLSYKRETIKVDIQSLSKYFWRRVLLILKTWGQFKGNFIFGKNWGSDAAGTARSIGCVEEMLVSCGSEVTV